MKTLVVLMLLGLAVALGPINHHLQQELDMGSPNNLAATAVAAAMEDGGGDFDFESARMSDSERLSGTAALDEDVSWPGADSERVQRLWGIADTTATVGHLFSFTVPTDAFSGEVRAFQASMDKGKALPRWLLFQPATGTFEGVPEASDVSELYVRVLAWGAKGESAKDVFAINVVPKSSYQIPDCDAGQDRLQISVLADAQLSNVGPKRRVSAIRNIARFLSVSPDTVKMLSQDSESAVSLHDETVVAAGPGNSKHGRTTQDAAVVLKFPSTCSTPGHALLLERLQALAKDGTLAEVLQLPVIGWLAQQTTPRLLTTKAPAREKRELEGSGDYDEYGGSEDTEEDPDEEVAPDSREIPTMSSPIFDEPPTATTPRLQTQHPHRHHHGQEESEEEAPVSPANSPGLVASIIPTPSLVPIRPTRLSDLVTTPDSPEASIEPSRVGLEDFMPVTPSFTYTSEPDYGQSEEDEYDVSSSASKTSSPQVTQPLPPISGSTPGWASSKESKASTSEEERTSTTEQVSKATTEEVEYGTKNFAPTIKQRLPKLPVVAGKVFRFTIPEDSFQDFEDGNTKKLRLIFKSAQGTALSSSSWIQFDTATQEVYGLPMEEQVSKWNFYVEAMDKEGKTVTDTLEVVVQHHKSTRKVNHEFTLQLKIDSKFDFPSSVDWQMNVLNGLTRFFGDSNENHITVINATASMSSSDNILFTWTNSTLPLNECPKQTLKQMYSAMTINDKGEPSMALKEAIGKTFTIKHVNFKGISNCDSLLLGPQTIGRPKESPPSVGGEGDNNFAPVLRNHVDRLSAKAGELLVYRVPEDTFYDNEDGSTRNMKLSLLLMNRAPLESSHWLQFDLKNQEFFGIPEKHDKGSREYQLVCEDSSGKTAADGLVVVVDPPENKPHNVEFRMTLSKPSLSDIEKNAGNKRKLVERIARLFGDPDTRNIVLDNLRQPPYQHHSGPSPTIEVLWYNKSLPTNYCPESEVASLRRLIMSEESQGHSSSSVSATHFSPRVSDIMTSEFNILKITMMPTGFCQGEFTFVHPPVVPEMPPDDDLNMFGSSKSSDEYLFTFIVPAVVIASMVLLALLVACALYRRRRRGKLAVGERVPGTPSFRTRGIPVIFQDELDEKAVEPVAKSPVIMKEEKPPLPPPEYSVPLMGMSPHPTPTMMSHRHPTAEDPLLSDEPEASPYQPPPPFTASGRENGRQSRPKPTPTYRKPPPYVPP